MSETVSRVRDFRFLLEGHLSSGEAAARLVRQAAETCQAAAAGLFLFGVRGHRGQLAASFLENLPEPAATLRVRDWKSATRRFRSSVQVSDPVSLPSGCPASSGAKPKAATPCQIWVPLRDSGKAVGFLYIETLGRPADRGLDELAWLADTAVPVLYRSVLRERLSKAGAPAEVIGTSPAFLEVERQIRTAASSESGAVLITGERGSGKEVAGWSIHCWSSRREKPFVPILASALPRELALDELFGHERNAFTDAARARPGRFQAADGGTVFLDEITDLDPRIQSALLRVIEYRQLSRIGSDLPLPVDVRVVASTNRNMSRLVRSGSFRADLYDRLNVFAVRLPPLRERAEDIRPLANFFLQKHCADLGRRGERSDERHCQRCPAQGAVCADASFYAALQRYSWPGNIRELQNTILQLVAAYPLESLQGRHLEEFLRQRQGVRPTARDWTLDTALRRHFLKTLRFTRGNQSQAAALLGIPLSTLRSKLKKLRIDLRRLR